MRPELVPIEAKAEMPCRVRRGEVHPCELLIPDIRLIGNRADLNRSRQRLCPIGRQLGMQVFQHGVEVENVQAKLRRIDCVR